MLQTYVGMLTPKAIVLGGNWITEGFPGGTSDKECLQMQEMQEMQVWYWGQEDPLE